MEAAQIYSDLEKNNKLVMAKDVRQALLYADRGEVDGAFVYKTDALLAKDATIAFTVPMDLYNRVEYPLALTTLGAESELAQQLYGFITGEAAATILEKYGFKPAR
jgi:molybdate transport system substrate-binding protein